jgi:hypothetical protein
MLPREMSMRLKLPKCNMRGLKSPASWTLPIMDLDKRKPVGFVRYKISPPIRTISLFEKYESVFGSDKECAAFAKGVQAVLKKPARKKQDTPVKKQAIKTRRRA